MFCPVWPRNLVGNFSATPRNVHRFVACNFHDDMMIETKSKRWDRQTDWTWTIHSCLVAAKKKRSLGCNMVHKTVLSVEGSSILKENGTGWSDICSVECVWYEVHFHSYLACNIYIYGRTGLDFICLTIIYGPQDTLAATYTYKCGSDQSIMQARQIKYGIWCSWYGHFEVG